MKYYLGIDPGKEGAFVIVNQDSKIVEMIGMPKIGKDYDKQGIREILMKFNFDRVLIENPQMIPAVSKSAVASLNHCIGLLEGMCLGLGLEYLVVRPKEWQKECFKHVNLQKRPDGGNDTKATSALASRNLWPRQDFRITNKGSASSKYNDGMTDAALLAEYGRRMFNKV